MRLLTDDDLSSRWGVSPRTLANWRSQGKGPAYVKLGSEVRYRIEDVEEYESNNSYEPEALDEDR